VAQFPQGPRQCDGCLGFGYKCRNIAACDLILGECARCGQGDFAGIEVQVKGADMFTANWSKIMAPAIALAIVTLSGCASSYVLVGQARPPISPDQVHIYLHPPAVKYDEIALLDSSSKGSFSFTDQGKTNTVIERLKEEAAKLGANGILLNGVGDQAAGSVGTGFASGGAHSAVGFGSSAAVFNKAGSGLAIYVPPDQVPSP